MRLLFYLERVYFIGVLFLSEKDKPPTLHHNSGMP